MMHHKHIESRHFIEATLREIRPKNPILNMLDGVAYMGSLKMQFLLKLTKISLLNISIKYL